MAKKKAPKNYVNNAEFYDALLNYLEKVKDAEKNEDRVPQVPEYIGKCILDIATRLSYKPNFRGYTFRDDMISDGIENAFMVIKNFDPEKSKNPFAYFTQIIYFAFLRRIEKERKQLYVKHKVIENSVLTDAMVNRGSGDTHGDADFVDLNNEYMSDFVEQYEETMRKKKEKAREASKKNEQNSDTSDDG